MELKCRYPIGTRVKLTFLDLSTEFIGKIVGFVDTPIESFYSGWAVFESTKTHPACLHRGSLWSGSDERPIRYYISDNFFNKEGRVVYCEVLPSDVTLGVNDLI